MRKNRKEITRPKHKLDSIAMNAADIEVTHVEVKDELEALGAQMSNQENEIEKRLANGETYAKIASELRISCGSLRVRVSRWRKRLRDHFRSD